MSLKNSPENECVHSTCNNYYDVEADSHSEHGNIPTLNQVMACVLVRISIPRGEIRGPYT